MYNVYVYRNEDYISETGLSPRPRAFGRHRVLLHAFSGRRRIGDLQFYIDKLNAQLTSCMWCRWTLWWIRRGVMRRSPQPDHSGFSPYEKGASWLSWEGHLVSRGPRGQKLQGDADPGLSHAAQGQAAHYWEQSCCVLRWPSSRPSAFEWICGVGASS